MRGKMVLLSFWKFSMIRKIIFFFLTFWALFGRERSCAQCSLVCSSSPCFSLPCLPVSQPKTLGLLPTWGLIPAPSYLGSFSSPEASFCCPFSTGPAEQCLHSSPCCPASRPSWLFWSPRSDFSLPHSVREFPRSG